MTSDAKIRGLDCGAATVDRISNLPVNLLDLILERLPMHDAARTTVLSKTWRNKWEMHPHLVFDNVFFSQLVSKNREKAQLSEVSITISNILLVHSGPVLKFHLSIPGDLSLMYTDLWIKNISKSGVRILELFNDPPIAYKMPSSLFSCLKLTHLMLGNCILNPPLRFGGFCNLISVVLSNVEITAHMSFGPQLETLNLIYCTGIKYLECQFKYNNNIKNLKIIESGKFDWRWFECTKKVEILALTYRGSSNPGQKIINIDKLVGNMPKIISLSRDGFFLECLEPGASVLKMLTTTMENLTFLQLSCVSFYDLVHIQCVLCLIRSSPKLQELHIGLEHKVKAGDGTESLSASNVEQYLQLPNLFDMILDQLKTVDIRGMVCSRSELHFINLLLASSPSLRWMKLHNSTPIDDSKEELRISRDLMRFHRASPSARMIWT